MSQFKFDKGRVKIGKYSLSNLALAEAGSALTFMILTFVLGWSAFKDARTYFADLAQGILPFPDKEPTQ